MTLLSIDSDAKTRKGVKRGYLTGVMYLAPANEADRGTMCPYSTPECEAGCLWTAGQAGVFPSINRGRVARTLRYWDDRSGFMDQLRDEIRALERKARRRGLIPAVRLNGTSDVPKLALQLAREFPHVQFYDYTKIPRPWMRWRANYHLTFSHSGENLADCLAALHRGVNVAVVFQAGKNEALPAMWHGYTVVDGDRDDLRFLDPVGVVVGLRAKGRARGLTAGGFVQIGTGVAA